MDRAMMQRHNLVIAAIVERGSWISSFFVSSPSDWKQRPVLAGAKPKMTHLVTGHPARHLCPCSPSTWPSPIAPRGTLPARTPARVTRQNEWRLGLKPEKQSVCAMLCWFLWRLTGRNTQYYLTGMNNLTTWLHTHIVCAWGIYVGFLKECPDLFWT